MNITLFDQSQEFKTKDEASAKLINMFEFTHQLDKMSELMNITKPRELEEKSVTQHHSLLFQSHRRYEQIITRTRKID